MINQELKIIQELWNKNILEPYVSENNVNELSRPYYFRVSKEYLRAAKKVMIVGQETRGFGQFTDNWPMEDIAEWCLAYYKFQVWKENDDRYEFTYNKSSFWKLFRMLEREGFVPCWNNVDKVHRTVDGKTYGLPEKLEIVFNSEIDDLGKTLLQKEIELADPDIIVFITGPYYETSMEQALGLDRGVLSNYRPTLEYYCKDISTVTNINRKVYWTYHPSFLNRNKGFMQGCVKIITS